MPIREDDFEVIEDTINDFSYFYDEEEEFKRNRKIIRKYKILSAVIFASIFIFLITILGLVRMKIYGTNNILTKSEIAYVEYKNASQEIFDYVQKTSVSNSEQYSLKNIVNREFSSNDVSKMNEYKINLVNYEDALNEIKLPNDEKFSNFNEALERTITIEIEAVDAISNNNKDSALSNFESLGKEFDVKEFGSLAYWYSECYPSN